MTHTPQEWPPRLAHGWPALPLGAWEATKDTLHMYTQIVGKLRLALAPRMNHTWHAALNVTARGLSTGPLACGDHAIELAFDLIGHQLVLENNRGDVRRIPLGASVKDFYFELMGAMRAMGFPVTIWTRPVEVSDPIPFDRDTRHATYDPEAVRRFFEVLSRVNGIFTEVRAGFTGKASPVQFYWGAFDLAITRFSGRPAAPPPDSTGFMRESSNAEQINLGFWVGGHHPHAGRIEQPMFYAYAYPKPVCFEQAQIAPPEAGWSEALGEFVLRYDDMRHAPHPTRSLREFAESTYQVGARLAHWPIPSFKLEPAPRLTISRLEEPDARPVGGPEEHREGGMNTKR